MTSTLVVTAPAPAPAPAAGGAGLVASASAVALRTVRKFLRTPQLVVFATMQGVLFLLIFRYVFGGAISGGGLPYVDFLVPGFVTSGVLFSGMGSAAGVAEDVEQGFFDRLRSLPIPRLSIMGGRSLADTGLAAWGLVITSAFGFAVGFRLHAGLGSALAAAGLGVVYAFALNWMFIFMGLVAGNAQAAQGMSMLVFPLTFVSSAYVPVASMPSWMRPIANNQPITAMVNAVRCLTAGPKAEAMLHQSAGHFVVLSLLWSAGFVAVFAPLAVARFSRR